MPDTLISMTKGTPIMIFTRGLAAGAMIAGLALGLPTPASAADPLNGHYSEVETTPDGRALSSDWYITPCGDSCASIADAPAKKPWGQANLVGGQWVLDNSGGVDCEDGGDIPNAIKVHYSWDPNTLAGSVQITNTVQACGHPPGYQETNNVQLAPV
jgi:hypothetical protein